MKVKLVVFDFDGTLVNLNQDVKNLRTKLQETAKKYGASINFKPIIEGILQLGEIAGDKAKEEAIRVINEDDLKLAENAKLIGEANQVCTELHKKGIKLAIFSRTYSGAITEVLERYNFPKFDIVLGRFEGGSTKKDQLKTILKTLKISPKNTIVVGDHIIDVKAGKSLGCITIGIENRRFDGKALRSAGADYVINSIDDIWGVLNI